MNNNDKSRSGRRRIKHRKKPDDPAKRKGMQDAAIAGSAPPAAKDCDGTELYRRDRFVIEHAARTRKNAQGMKQAEAMKVVKAKSEPRKYMPQRATELRSGLDSELIDNLPAGMAIIRLCVPGDVQTWRLTAANKTAREIIGESLTDFLLTRVAESFHFQQKMEDIYRGILQRRVRRDLGWMGREVGGVRKTYAVSGFPVPPNHIGLLMQDISLHTEVRKALAEHQGRYEEISHAVRTFLWRGDRETLQTKWVSNEAQELLGYWPEHWRNVPNFWIDHIHAEDCEMVLRLMRENGSTAGTRFDYRMKAADGRTVWLHAVIHVNETVAGAQELAGVMVDITARKNAEDAAHDLSGKLLQAQDNERRHVARELHDSLGQYLSVLGMNVGMLARTMRGLSGEQQRLLAEMNDLVETCLREVRTVSYLMHPPMLDEAGLVPALQWYANGFSERSHIPVEIEGPPKMKGLPKEVEMAFFRVTQEALTNVYRHSRSATATIRLREQDRGITLEVADHGRGVDGVLLDGIISGNGGAKGLGIRGMRERMRELGGTLEVTSNKGGTVIRAYVPWTARVFAATKKEEGPTASSAAAVAARHAG
jgi:PAS domain S-box-containing protein